MHLPDQSAPPTPNGVGRGYVLTCNLKLALRAPDGPLSPTGDAGTANFQFISYKCNNGLVNPFRSLFSRAQHSPHPPGFRMVRLTGREGGRRLLPIIIEHTIDERSPLCGHTYDTLMAVRPPVAHLCNSHVIHVTPTKSSWRSPTGDTPKSHLCHLCHTYDTLVAVRPPTTHLSHSYVTHVSHLWHPHGSAPTC